MVNKGIANEILQDQDKDGMLRRALERIIQLYTDKSHFVYELLQNAEDAGATKIKFLQYSDQLVVLHDGHPFSLENLKRLCDIGKSDKVNDLNQIGEFGVGFKSVFGICEKVQLFSHPTEADLAKEYPQFAVEIRDFTHPIDIDDQKIEDGYTTKFIFPYKVGLPFSGFVAVDKLNEVLSKRLQNLGVTTLLFMKNLQSIDYQIELPQLKKSGSYSLKKEMLNEHCALVSAIGETDYKDGKEDISYLIFSREVQGIQAGRTIDIAFALNVKEDGGYDFKPSRHPYISVYFPTETESKLKFIVQGPYRTTPNRSSVPADDEDNIELAEQTSQLLKDSIIELRDSGKLDYSFLRILPVEDDIFENAPLFTDMFGAIVDMMHEERILLCKDGTYASAECVKIARGSDFAELFTDELLTELINDEIDYHWLPTFLTETNKMYKPLYDFLTDVYMNIEIIRPENLRKYLDGNKNFLLNRDDEWLVKFYNLYESVSNAFSKQRSANNMLTAEFVKTTAGEFVAPYRRSNGSTWGGYLPNIFLPSENIDDIIGNIAFVDKYIYQQCKHFFTEILNLQKPDEYAIFISDFKARCEEMKSTVDEQQHIADVKRLLKYRCTTDHCEEVGTLIRKHLLLKCRKEGKVVYVNPDKEMVYFSVNSDGMSIEQYFKHIVVYAYVDTDFYEAHDISAESLKVFGIRESIALCEELTDGKMDKIKGKPKWNTEGEFRWKLNLRSFPDVLQYISEHPKETDSMAKSSFIFRFLQNNELKLQGTVHIRGKIPDKNNECAEIVGVLRGELYYVKYPEWDGKWLYTELGDLVAQKDISKYDLDSRLYGDVRLDSKIYEILGFKKKEIDYRKEAEKEYDDLSEERKNRYFEIELQRRYGISVTDLDVNFGENSVGVSKCSLKAPLDDTYDFPSSRVKNWDSLRKHTAEVLYFANPVKYEYRIRRVRVSKPENEVRAYLKSMYRVDGIDKYACQMCHEPFSNVEMCQIKDSLKEELDSMHLCLCPNCAAKYRKMRAGERELSLFLENIGSLTDTMIEDFEPVKVSFAGESIWFTQTHIAEIRELMVLQEEVDNYEDSVGKNL